MPKSDFGRRIRGMPPEASVTESGTTLEATPFDDPRLAEYRHLVSERALSGETVKDRPSRILRAGMALTIEPGLYISPAVDVPKEFWNIGIRIEDDAIVTASGCELISRGVPVQADEIEALMRG